MHIHVVLKFTVVLNNHNMMIINTICVYTHAVSVNVTETKLTSNPESTGLGGAHPSLAILS